ncbi:MBL fold metallo-hydrolase [Aestuariibacter halophilus]|uniref:MBL fold metallo-hydrolase n=1 Tax=Fluctibacter halophilus TaxID=226011 RepID=A0ABS8G8N4_9ALTE|nr:MBL fold metallo-hydrolase [Aestuariibacter halophilus]MCC2616819.1 MBL fold metallo-hydrolase [Aestuariibacter halophilus]
MQNHYVRVRNTLRGALFILTTLVASHVAAATKENQIIQKTVTAYGGNTLLKLQSLTLNDSFYQYSQWQSSHALQGPMIGYLSEQQVRLSIDFVNHRKALRQATFRLVDGHGSEIPSVTHRLFTDTRGYSVDHALQVYYDAPAMTFDNADSGMSRLIDTLIVKQLYADKDHSEWRDIAYIQGVPHDVLSVNSGQKNEYTVYLNQQNGYLSRVLRKQGAQLTTYNFLQHQRSGDLGWARQVFVSTPVRPVYHSTNRTITFNTTQEGDFNLPEIYPQRSRSAVVDSTELTLQKLAKDVYWIGQDWSYSLFIDMGDYYISAGAWQTDRESHAWQNGLDLLHKTTGKNKPVKQHIVTHHHHDHMMGLHDVIKQGAELVIHPNNIPAVQQHLSKPLSEQRFIPIADTTLLANDKVMLFDVPNSHANHNLVIYLPEQKILFSEDMFGSGLQQGFHSPANWPDLDTYNRLQTLNDKVTALALDVEQYVSSHHARVLSQQEIDQALSIIVPKKQELLMRLFAEH